MNPLLLAVYRVYQIVIMLPLMLAATVVTALIVIAGSLLGGGRWAGYYPPMVWSRLMCWLAWVRVKVSGRSNITPGKAYVFVANHQGAYDIFAIYGWLGHNFRWMMKQALRKIPLVGLACEMSHQIYVDNSSPSRLKATMQRAESILRSGLSVVVFPEGARSWDGKVRPFKRGAFLLATEFSLPVVPITIDGAFAVLPRFKKLPMPGTIRLTVHPQIDIPTAVDGAAPTETEAQTYLASASRAAILASLPPQ